MITFKEDYSGRDSSFPRHDISPKKKLTKEWMKQYAEAMYAAWLNGATKICYDDVDAIQENRRYMRAEQDVEQYKKAFLGSYKESEIDFIRDGLMNIEWTVPAIAPKYVNVIQNMFHDSNFEVLVNALDEKSSRAKASKKWKTWVTTQLKDSLEQMNGAMGMDMFEIPENLPSTIEELEFQESIGAFRLSKEISFEAAVVEVLRRCDLQEINKKVINDLFAWGKACIRDYVDPVTQKVNVEYCDIARVIISYTNDNYYNPEYFGLIKTYSLSDIMERAGLSEEEARNIASAYYRAGSYQNTFEFYDRQDDNRVWGWEKFDVQVLEAEFESTDTTYKEVIEKNKFGNKAVYSISPEKVKKSKNEVERTDVKMRYRCSWIIGSDHVFDWGYQYDIPRATPAQAGSSAHFYDVGKCFIDILKPHINQACLAWFRIQNTIAQAPESGLVLNYDSFDNVVMNNKKLKPSELIKLGKLSGVWIHKKKGFDGRLNADQSKPVEFFEGGAGRQLQENIELYRWNIQTIEEQLGMPPVASAGRQERETTLGEQQLLFSSATNAIKHFGTAIKDLVKHSCQNIILRVQIIAKHNPDGYEALVNTIGYEKSYVLKLGPAEATCEMGVEILPIYGAQQKDNIYQAALQSMQAGKSGGIGIRMSDYMKIKRLLEAGLIRAAENWLQYSESREEKRQLQIQQENMQLNAQMAQQAEAQKGQNALQEIGAQGQVDQAIQQAKTEGDLAKEALKAATQGTAVEQQVY